MTFNSSIYEVPNSATEKIMMQSIQCMGDQQRHSEENIAELAYALRTALAHGPLLEHLTELIKFYPANILINDFMNDWENTYRDTFTYYCLRWGRKPNLMKLLGERYLIFD